MDDPTLLHRYVHEGSEPAFAELVARYLPLVHAAALRRVAGDEHRAREVTQMVFTELAHKAAKLLRHPALAAWLHPSTRWHAANLRRAEQRRTRHEHDAAQHLAIVDESSPAPEPAWEQLRPVLDAALDALRETDREAVLLRYMMNRPFAAIGQNLGLSENAARMRVDRALDTLRSALARHGITSTTAALALALTQHAGATTPAGLDVGAIACTACQSAAAGAAITSSGVVSLKLATASSSVLALALAAGLWHQTQINAELQSRLGAAPVSHVSASVASPVSADVIHPALAPGLLAALEDEILAAAEFAVPLTPEQQERVRLDTIIRKGELDRDYAMLFRRLALPPRELDAFKTLLVERNQAVYDARQLAKEFDLELESLAEERALIAAATQEIDSRIETAIGSDRLKTFHEFQDLSVYLFTAGGLVFDELDSRASAELDDQILHLARALRDAAPELAEQAFQNPSVAAPFSEPARLAVSTIAGQDARQRLERQEKQQQRWNRILEIQRDAVLAGKVPTSRVSGRGTAAAYEAALATSAESKNK